LIKNLYLENFMAHQATSIDLSSGVTVITGPNNIGKSAVVEAVRYLVYNPAPKNVIRHGAKKALVRLELDSGASITWQRQDKNASYTIQQPGQEPEAYHKFGRDVPKDVSALLCLDQVEIDTEKIDIHLGNQREPIFLLNRPGSHAAGFFAASTEADYLLKMQQALKMKIDQAKREEKNLSKELDDLAQQLGHYEPLDDLGAQLGQAEQLYRQIQAADRQLPLLAERIGALQGAQDSLYLEKQLAAVLELVAGPPTLADITGLALDRSEIFQKTEQHRREISRTAVLTDLTSPPALKPITELDDLLFSYQANLTRHKLASQHEDIFSELRACPDLWETGALATLLSSCQVQQTQRLTAAQRAQVLAQAQQPPALEPVVELPGLIQDLADRLHKTTTWQKCQSILKQLLPWPDLPETDLLTELVTRLDREQARSDLMAQRTRLLGKLMPPPIPATLLDLENSLLNLHQATEALAFYQASLDGLMQQLACKREEIRAYLQDAGECPLCGGSLDLEHFLESHYA
jgi:DNA repair exonuclease SbcCD ATPase subunit